MNKLLLNDKGRNHIRVLPLKGSGIEIPEGEKERVLLANSIFKELQTSSDAKRLVLYKHKGKGYLISVWQIGAQYYLIQSIRNEFKTFNNTIYVGPDGPDMLSIAKFLRENIETIMEDYKNQILDARDWLVRETLKDGNS